MSETEIMYRLEELKIKLEIYQNVLEAIVLENPNIIVKEMDGIEREIKLLERYRMREALLSKDDIIAELNNNKETKFTVSMKDVDNKKNKRNNNH